MSNDSLELVEDRGKRAGGDWVTSIATHGEIHQLTDIVRPSAVDGSGSAAIASSVDWQDAARWPTLHALLKDRGLEGTETDPWLLGFIDGALTPLGWCRSPTRVRSQPSIANRRWRGRA